VTPLYKYEVYGPDAAEFLSRIMVRNIRKLKPSQVFYTCWCDDQGKVVDDGTVSRLEDEYFRVTAADASYGWLSRFARGYDVTIRDSSLELGALSVQGPKSRALLNAATNSNVDDLKYFYLKRTTIEGIDVVVSRTGYTGDLGYEVWVQRDRAVEVWDAIMEAGRPYGAMPVGLDAMDISRIEAGYLLNGVDYYNASHALIESRKSSPFELDLGWMVRVKRPNFIGRDALIREKALGPSRVLRGIETDWDEFEALFDEHKLPPEVPAGAWRDPVPIYNQSGEQVGYANSGAWSPMLKKNLALATLQSEWGKIGQELRFEVTVEYKRRTVKATVVEKPFFDPPRKRA
jgi:aminomethyltransferase